MNNNQPNNEPDDDENLMQDIEKKKISIIKQKMTEKKRTEQRNEQINFHRNRQPIQISQLAKEDINLDFTFDESNPEQINQKIDEFKQKIINLTTEEELWKALLLFDVMSKKMKSVNVKFNVSCDPNFISSLFKITQSTVLTDECKNKLNIQIQQQLCLFNICYFYLIKLASLSLLSDVTDSFKTLTNIGPQADQQVFDQYIRIYRQTQTEKTFATLLQGISQLCIDSIDASTYFIQNGLYEESLCTFERMSKNSIQYDKSIKDLCVIFNGLSKIKITFDFTHQKLKVLFDFLAVTKEIDILYDVSIMIESIVKAYLKNTDQLWVQQKLQNLYNLGLMSAIFQFISQENIWIPVQGNKVLNAISHTKNDQIKQEFMQQLHDSGIFEYHLNLIRNHKIILALKYHSFQTLNSLVKNDCIIPSQLNYLVQSLLHPLVIEKKQEQSIEIIWEIFLKDRDDFEIEITKPLIDILCVILLEKKDAELTMKCLDIFDRMLLIVQNDSEKKRKHKNLMLSIGLNQILEDISSSKNDELSEKAFSLISHIENFEKNDSDMEEEVQQMQD